MTIDPGRPSLSSIPPSVRPAFDRLVAEGTRYFGSPIVGVEPIGSIERAFSTLQRFRIHTTRDSMLVYVKRLRAADGEGDDFVRRRVVSEYDETRRVYEGLPAGDGLTAIRPLAVFPDLHVFVTEEARGDTLRSLLVRGAQRVARRRDTERLAHAVGRVGRWLRAYQSLEACSAPVPARDARAYVEARVHRLCARHCKAFGPADGARILRALDFWLSRVTPADLRACRVHADFNPENILVDGETVAVLDFSEARPGLRLGDLAHLYLHLERLKGRLRFSRSVVDLLQRELLQGYGEPGVAEQPLFRVLALQQSSAYLVLVGEQIPRRAARLRTSYLRWKRHQTFKLLERLDIM